MVKHRKKYRSIIYLLSLFYANFFFLSPFFHYHNSDTNISHGQNNIIHSHFFNDNPHTEDSDTHFEDENHHSHFSQNNYIYSSANSREIQSSVIIDFYTTLDYSKIELEISAIDKHPLVSYSKAQWEKYVHSATNISPPLS